MAANPRFAEYVSLSIGALSQPLHKQLGIPARRCGILQRDADAIVRLKIRGLISESVALAAERRLMKDIIALMETRLRKVKR